MTIPGSKKGTQDGTHFTDKQLRIREVFLKQVYVANKW